MRIIAETVKGLRRYMPILNDYVDNYIDDKDEDEAEAEDEAEDEDEDEDEAEDEDEDEDEAEDEGATGQDHPPIHSFPNLSSNAATMTSPMVVQTKSEDNSSEISSSGKEGGGGGGKGRRRSLGTSEPKITLTAEALYHHNKTNIYNNVW